MTALWVQEAAERFWADAGGPPPGFPRDLRPALAFALPLVVVEIADLRIATLNAWLARRDLAVALDQRDRALRACLLVQESRGLVFLDAADAPDERRFSLAHEVAHYLVEYAQPRQRAADMLGPQALAVLGGARPPTRQERVDALLARVPLHHRLHLMERTPSGHPANAHISAAEQRADALALELLAPAEALAALRPGRVPKDQQRALLEHTLVHTFGLPVSVASTRARELVPASPSSSLLQRLELH